MTKRQDYMNGNLTFEQYYRSVNKAAGVIYRGDLAAIRKAIADGDDHLNTIPLKYWDAKAAGASFALSHSLKKHGDFYSMAGGVCCMKQAARDAIS